MENNSHYKLGMYQVKRLRSSGVEIYHSDGCLNVRFLQICGELDVSKVLDVLCQRKSVGWIVEWEM